MDIPQPCRRQLAPRHPRCASPPLTMLRLLTWCNPNASAQPVSCTPHISSPRLRRSHPQPLRVKLRASMLCNYLLRACVRLVLHLAPDKLIQTCVSEARVGQPQQCAAQSPPACAPVCYCCNDNNAIRHAATTRMDRQTIVCRVSRTRCIVCMHAYGALL